MPRRSGGRQARVAERAAPLADAVKPVRPGKPADNSDPCPPPALRPSWTTPSGFSTGWFRRPDASLHRNLHRGRAPCSATTGACACREIWSNGPWSKPGGTWCCTVRTRGGDLDLSGTRVHFSTAGAAVMVADPENGLYRDSAAQDLYDMARIADTCDHIHMFQRTCVPRDIPDNYALDIIPLTAG